MVVCTSACTEDAVLTCLQAGAVGFLRKDTLTPESPLGRRAGGRLGRRRRRTRPARRAAALDQPGRARRPARRGAPQRARAAGAGADRRRPPHARGGRAALLLRAHREERPARRRDQAQRPQPLAGRRVRGARGPDLSARCGGTLVDHLLEGKRIVICAGPGGVGEDHGCRRARPSGWPRAASTSSWSRSTRPTGWPTRSASTCSTTSRGRSTRRCSSQVGIELRRRAVGDDARLQAHIRRADRARGAVARGPRRGARQPDLPGALERGRRLAGVHGDREALRPGPRRRVRPARARHAAVAQRARLPRRARPADGVLPGPRDPDVPAPGRHRRQGLRRGHGRRVRRCCAASRASTCSRTCRSSSARWAG